MITICILLCLLGTKVAQAAVQRGTGRKCDDQKINVLSFVNPDSDIGYFKNSLDDVPSFANLANDPLAAFAESFTICSDIMSVFSTKMNFLMFFNLLGSNGEQLLKAVMIGENFLSTRYASGQIPTVFPN